MSTPIKMKICIILSLGAIAACYSGEKSAPAASIEYHKQGTPSSASSLMESQSDTTNSIGMVFIAIPAGSFMMGGSDPDAYSREKPPHKVTIGEPFNIGKYEVTQAQWEAVMGSNPLYLGSV
jgi:formylglycine-generating enzyme required for sulfatase activity